MTQSSSFPNGVGNHPTTIFCTKNNIILLLHLSLIHQSIFYFSDLFNCSFTTSCNINNNTRQKVTSLLCIFLVYFSFIKGKVCFLGHMLSGCVFNKTVV